MMRNMFAEQQGDPFDYTDKYNTPLTPDEERRFQAWARKNPQRLKDLYDYDVRGFWKAGRKTSGNGHGGDEFKKPNHPTFSTYSNYSSPLRQGGTWVAPAIPRQDYGGYTFFASPDNMRTQDGPDLQNYFRRVEPGSRVVLPLNASGPYAR